MRNNYEFMKDLELLYSYDAWEWWCADTDIIWSEWDSFWHYHIYIFRKAQRVPFRKFRSPRWHTCTTGE